MPLTPGTTLGVYEVLSAIGAGGMGEVYKARDTKLDRDVAPKGLPDVFTNDPVLAGLAQSQRRRRRDGARGTQHCRRRRQPSLGRLRSQQHKVPGFLGTIIEIVRIAPC